MYNAKKKRCRIWPLLCLAICVVVLALFITRLFDNGPVHYSRIAIHRDTINKEEFFLANEDKFEYIVDRLKESSYEGDCLWIGITKRTKEVILSTEDYYFDSRVSHEELGIVLDDEFSEYLRVILIDGKLGRVSVTRWPSRPKLEVVFGNGRRDDPKIYYYEPKELFWGVTWSQNLMGNWYFEMK